MSVQTEFYLQSEIKEQNDLIRDLVENKERLTSINVSHLNLGKVSHIQIIACGSSYHAGLLGMKYLEKASNIPISIAMGSEFIFHNTQNQTKTLYIVISQSGETKDIIHSLKKLDQRSCQIVGISNNKNSTLSNLIPHIFYLNCGEEKSTPATKTFTMSCLYLYLFSLSLSKNRGFLNRKRYEKNLSTIEIFSNKIEEIFNLNEKIINLTKTLLSFKSFICLGNGADYPIALECALKIREISFLHAEGMPTGELKHGPLAMLDRQICVIALISNEDYYNHQKDLLEKIILIGANLVILTTLKNIQIAAASIINIPNSSFDHDPLAINIASQLLALSLGQELGRNVDESRNLSKVIMI